MKTSTLQFRRGLARLSRLWTGLTGSSGQIYVADRVSEYETMWRGAASHIGAEFRVLADRLWQIELAGRTTRVYNDILEFDNPVILDMAGMKPLMYRLLSGQGLPVPEHLVFPLERFDDAVSFLAKHPRGCVVKPANGTSSGNGVTTHIQTNGELTSAVVLASLFDNELIIEPMVPGLCYRMLVLKGKMIHAVGRRGLRLRGDSVSSVGTLIAGENKRRLSNNLSSLDIDRDCLFTLEYQQLSLETVPEEGKEFLVKSVADPRRERVEVRTVYDSDVTASVCRSLCDSAELAARVLQSDLVGVDFITTDISVPLSECGGVFNEVNTTPGLHHHYDKDKEAFPKPAVDILRVLLEQPGNK